MSILTTFFVCMRKGHQIASSGVGGLWIQDERGLVGSALFFRQATVHSFLNKLGNFVLNLIQASLSKSTMHRRLLADLPQATCLQVCCIYWALGAFTQLVFSRQNNAILRWMSSLCHVGLNAQHTLSLCLVGHDWPKIQLVERTKNSVLCSVLWNILYSVFEFFDALCYELSWGIKQKHAKTPQKTVRKRLRQAKHWQNTGQTHENLKNAKELEVN